MSDDQTTRPGPEDEETREAWAQTGLRHRMLRKNWAKDAMRRMQDFFSPETYEFLPPPVLAFNTFKNFVTETCTLYDGPVTTCVVSPAEEPGEEPGLRELAAAESRAIGLDLLWTQQQETLENVRGLNDALLLRTVDREAQCIRYLPVTPDCVYMRPDPVDPSQPAVVDFYHCRERAGADRWVRDRWRKAIEGSPASFMIEEWEKSDGAGQWVDRTLDYMPGLDRLPGRFPYWEHPPAADAVEVDQSTLGAPIWPWTAYHWRVSHRLRDAEHGCELVDLSLVACVLWTYWVGGLRDVAMAARYLLDADIAAKADKGQPWLAFNPMMVLKLRSTEGNRPGTFGSVPSPMDVKAYAEAIGDFQASGAIVHGLSSADVSVSKSGLSRVSGFAIEVSREGKRKAERRSLKPQALGDRHNLAGAARLANAYFGTKLPTLPDEWSLSYTHTGRTSAEASAEVAEVTGLVEAKLLHPADAIRRFDPGKSREAAEKYLLKAAEFRHELAQTEATGEEPGEMTGPSEALDLLLSAPDDVVPPNVKQALRDLAARMASADPAPSPPAPPAPDPTTDPTT